MPVQEACKGLISSIRFPPLQEITDISYNFFSECLELSEHINNRNFNKLDHWIVVELNEECGEKVSIVLLDPVYVKACSTLQFSLEYDRGKHTPMEESTCILWWSKVSSKGLAPVSGMINEFPFSLWLEVIWICPEWKRYKLLTWVTAYSWADFIE